MICVKMKLIFELSMLFLISIAQSRRHSGLHSNNEDFSIFGNVISMNYPQMEEIYVRSNDPAKKSKCNPRLQKTIGKLKEDMRCRPMDSIVKLTSPDDGFAKFFPSEVVVKRCGGSCMKPKTCLPMKQKNTTFDITMYINGSHKLRCKTVDILEDIECDCGCEQLHHCNTGQIYDKKECKCICDNTKEDMSCGIKMHWDHTICSCVCSQVKQCTTGSKWLPKQCKCGK